MSQKKTTTYKKEFTLKAFLQLGGKQVVLSGTMARDKTVLQVEFESLSLHQIISDIIHLVRPTYTLHLPVPWDKIFGFELKHVVLSYNIKEKSIGFSAALPEMSALKPLLVELKRVYVDAKSVHEVKIAFDGLLFGEEIKREGWNLVGSDGPPTPPPPPSLFELKFLGLGQRLRLTNAAQYEHVSDAIADMKSLFDPPESGALIPSFANTLVFDNRSNWLFGLDAEIMATVDLSIVFNDPNLYGLFISLKGEKAKSLAGLQFEILYKKITDDIGVYQIELKLPAYIRNMEFGTVSVTLPQIGIDIYTNGNFKIDFGFPRGLDFTGSFAVQVFPFVGFGGFYFAVLNASTSSTVPATTNGTFNPVLEFGIGLQLGVGKVLDKGILQAAATLTYVGIIEGTLAWFKAHPKVNVDPSLPDFYYRLSGTFAIVGKIWGSINLAIINATLDFTVYASAIIVLEASEPILLTFSAGVSVSLKVSVDLGLFTIHIKLSFRTTISYHFVIGHSSPAQWNQRVERIQSPAGLPADATPVLVPLTEQEANVAVAMNWQANFTDEKPKPIDLYYLTQFSVADATDNQQQTVGIGMLFAPTSDQTVKDQSLSSLANIRTLDTFEQVAAAAFCWALNAADSESKKKNFDAQLTKKITNVQLANIVYTLNQSPMGMTPFSYENIIDFIKHLFILNIKDKPDSGVKELHLSLFPIIPDLFFTAQDRKEIQFSSYHRVGTEYLEQVKKLLNRLSMGAQSSDKKLSSPVTESLSTLLFRDYFLLLIKALLQSALDVMQVYKFTIPATMGDYNKTPTLVKIAKIFTVSEVSEEDIIALGVSNENNAALLNPMGTVQVSGIIYSIQSGDSLSSIVKRYSKDPEGESKKLIKQVMASLGDQAIYAAGKTIELEGVSYKLEKGDSLNSIIKGLNACVFINGIKNNTDILQHGEIITFPKFLHSIKEKESLASIIKEYRIEHSDSGNESELINQIVKLNGDKAIFVAGNVVETAGRSYELKEGDTINSIAKAMKIDDSLLTELNNKIKESTDILQAFKQLRLPTIKHSIQDKDTLLSIANQYQVELKGLIIENQNNETLLQASKKMIIENVRSLQVGELLTHLYHDGALEHAAGTASRFFMYGLRLPQDIKEDNRAEPFQALYRLTGQQFTFNLQVDSETGALNYNKVTLSKSATNNHSGDDNDINKDNSDPLPWVAFNGDKLKPLEHEFLEQEIRLARKYGKVIFSPTIELGPVSIKLYNDQFKTFAFRNPILWQHETTNEKAKDKAAGETGASAIPIIPSVWLFPPSLRSIRHQSPKLQMVVATQPQKSAAIQKDVLDTKTYTWSTLLPFTIRKLPQDAAKNAINANTYEVYGTDAAGIELLTELVELVNLTTIVKSTHILFSSDTENNEANALQSYDESGLTLFINTNLSTETNPDTLITSAEKKDPSISSTTSAEMIIRLWKASLVRTGGFYLYLKNRDGAGLPESIFSSDQTAEINLLISYHEKEQIALYMNSVAIERAVDTRQSQLLAQWDVPTDKSGKFVNPDQQVKEGKIARIPAIFPGNAGFKLVRENPNKKFGITETNPNPSDPFAYQLETQYNLLDFEIIETSEFKDVGEGLPAGPEKDHLPESPNKPAGNKVEDTDLKESWKYKRAFPIAKIIKDTTDTNSRYAGLNKTIAMRFAWRDNYGNQLRKSIPDLHFTVKYFDYLVPLTQWPNLNVDYEFMEAESGDRNFQINFHFDPESEYRINTDNPNKEDLVAEIKTLIEKVRADFDVYQKVLDQIKQDDVKLFFTVSMTPDIDAYPREQGRVDSLKIAMIKYVEGINSQLGLYIDELARYQKLIPIEQSARAPKIDSLHYQWEDSIGNTNPKDIFALEVIFSISRNEELVNPVFKNVPQVKSVETYIQPKAENPPLLTIDSSEESSSYVNDLDNKIFPEAFIEKLPTSEWQGIQSVEVRIKSREWQVKNKEKIYILKYERKQFNLYLSAVGFAKLADSFEKVYPGMKVSSAYTRGKQQKEVWIVRFKPDIETNGRNFSTKANGAIKKSAAGIGFTVHYDQALFYAPQPLSTHLVSLDQVPIRTHTEYCIEPPPHKPTNKTFSMIDPETWAIEYLETLETTLRPEFSIPMTMFDNLLGQESKGFLHALLQAKQRVAEAIAFQTLPVLQDKNMQRDGLGVAREKLKQQLLINLLDAYKTNAVVQYNVDVESPFPDNKDPMVKIAPNLFGQPHVVQEFNPKDEKAEKDGTHSFSFSTGKVALNGKGKNNAAPGNSYLTFLFTTQTERDQSILPLTIDYKINHLEFDIRSLEDKVDPSDREDIKNYSVSKWLSFVKPLASTKSIRPEIITRIPIPLRHYPKSPTWNNQQFIAKEQPAAKSLSIKHAKQIDYHFSYVLPQFTAQDTLNFEVLFNCKKVEEKSLARFSSPTDELDRKLQYSLAQFVEAKDSVLADMRTLLPQVNVAMDETFTRQLKTLLASYYYLANQVADAWYERFDPNKFHTAGKPELTVITAKFDLEEGRDTQISSEEDEAPRFSIKMTNWSVKAKDGPITFIGFPTIFVDGYQAEAYGYEENGIIHPQAINHENRNRAWEKIVFLYFKLNKKGEKKYLSFKEGKQQLNRSVQFSQLDVLQVQNAWAGLYVVRNANLGDSSGDNKKTSEEFIYRTPLKRFANPLTPMLDLTNLLDIAKLHADGPADLKVFLTALLKTLLEVNVSSHVIFQPTTLKIVTSYSFSSNPDVGSILQPCFLIPPTLFDEGDIEGSGTGITQLTKGIMDWFANNRPLQLEGKLYFDITFYTLLADNDLPILRLRQLFIDVGKITTLKQFAE